MIRPVSFIARLHNSKVSTVKLIKCPQQVKNATPHGGYVTYVFQQRHCMYYRPRYSTARLPLPLYFPMAQNEECVSFGQPRMGAAKVRSRMNCNISPSILIFWPVDM